MDMEELLGQMVQSMKDITSMTKNMEEEDSSGLMEESLMDIGEMVNKMELVYSRTKKVLLRPANFRKVNSLTGCHRRTLSLIRMKNMRELSLLPF